MSRTPPLISSALVALAALCSPGCAGDGDDTGDIGQAFTLSLEPVVPANQDPFTDLDSLLLVVEPEAGLPVRYPFPQTSGSPDLVGVEPAESATLAIEGYIGDELVAFGRTAPLSLVEGEVSARVLVSEVDSFAWLENLDRELHQSAAVPTGSGGFLVFGGSEDTPNISSSSAVGDIWRIEIADPSAGLAFSSAGEMPGYTVDDVTYTGRTGHSATLLEGEGAWEGMVLVAGGADGFLNTPTATDHAFLYDPALGAVEYETVMDSPRWGHSVAVNDGDIYLFGGVNRSELLSLTRVMSVEYFDRGTGTFEYLGSNLSADGDYIPLFGGAAAMGSSGVLYCGGFKLDEVNGDGAADWMASDECWVVSISGVLSDADALPERLLHFSLTTLADDRVLLTGGVRTDDWVLSQSELVAPSPDIFIYDPATDTWEDTDKDLRIPRARHATALLPDGRVLIAGGSADGSDMVGQTTSAEGLACAEVYDPSNNTLLLVDDCTEDLDVSTLPDRMNAPSIAADMDYGVLLVGGLNQSSAVDVAALWVGPPE